MPLLSVQPSPLPARVAAVMLEAIWGRGEYPTVRHWTDVWKRHQRLWNVCVWLSVEKYRRLDTREWTFTFFKHCAEKCKKMTFCTTEYEEHLCRRYIYDAGWTVSRWCHCSGLQWDFSVTLDPSWHVHSPTHSPPSILRHGESDPEVRAVDSRADCVHVQEWANAVGAVLHAAVGGWAEAAVVQAAVAFVVAALLQSDGGGWPRHTDVDH